jgi:hypothetical protein
LQGSRLFTCVFLRVRLTSCFSRFSAGFFWSQPGHQTYLCASTPQHIPSKYSREIVTIPNDVDRHCFDADPVPDPNFHNDADPDLDPDWHQNNADSQADPSPSFTHDRIKF